MSKEAMKLALEALEKADRHCPVNTEAKVFVRLSITALREALAEQPPAQRPWQGLTDQEIEQGCKESWVTEQAWQSAVWWAEAKLKEKNNG